MWDLYHYCIRVVAGLCNSRTVGSSQFGGGLRRRVLKEVDNELSKGDDRAALSLVKEFQGIPGSLRGFGAARQLSRGSLGNSLSAFEQWQAISGGVVASNVLHFNPQQILTISLGLLFLWTFDSVSFTGGLNALILDTIGHTLSPKYHNRAIQHEAGHFLIAYLLGILPKHYTLTSLEALKKDGSLNVQAGTAFVDFEFVEEVNKGRVSATMLNMFSCVALAGVATEYLLFGCAEGGCADINQLDRLLRSLGFTQKKSDSLVRWAILNTIMLRRHENARAKQALAMTEERSVGSCIDAIEKNLSDDDYL